MHPPLGPLCPPASPAAAPTVAPTDSLPGSPGGPLASDLAVLVPQDALRGARPSWQLEAFDEVAVRLADPGFPCVFSRNAFRKRLIHFIFVEGTDEGDLAGLAAGLAEYVELARSWDGRLDTAYPLVVLFSPRVLEAGADLSVCHHFGWWVLSRLASLDRAAWPADVPTSPGEPAWSMCFQGMQLFVNMSAPAHRQRLSRNLGSRFALVINPRERFDVFAGDTPSGRNTREIIRQRVDRYDRVPRSPLLGSFGGESLEWTQYSLPDDNAAASSLEACPFHPTTPPLTATLGS